MKFSRLLLLFCLVFSTSCDFFLKDNGMFGSCKTKQEALKNGSPIYSYVADKTKFLLLDASSLTTDTAWTEVSFTYLNGKRILNSSYGYHFSIPFKKATPNTFTFNFSLLDTTNRIFTNGIEENLCQLCPINLKNEMKIILEQKNIDSSQGWMHPIVTDTITYRRSSRE